MSCSEYVDYVLVLLSTGLFETSLFQQAKEQQKIISFRQIIFLTKNIRLFRASRTVFMFILYVMAVLQPSQKCVKAQWNAINNWYCSYNCRVRQIIVDSS